MLRVMSGFSTVPSPTAPSFLRSNHQDLVSPCLFLSWKTMTASDCLTAFFFKPSSLASACSMKSKTFEDGNLSKLLLVHSLQCSRYNLPSERPILIRVFVDCLLIAANFNLGSRALLYLRLPISHYQPSYRETLTHFHMHHSTEKAIITFTSLVPQQHAEIAGPPGTSFVRLWNITQSICHRSHGGRRAVGSPQLLRIELNMKIQFYYHK